MPSLDEFHIIESEQEDTLETEVEALETQTTNISAQGVALMVYVSSPGRKVSKRTRSSHFFR